MSKEAHVVELLPAYALGALEADEVQQVESHLSECDPCRVELRVIEEITDDLPLALVEMDPPPTLRQQLMARIELPKNKPEPVAEPSYWQQMMTVFRQNKAIAFSQLALFILVLVSFAGTVLLWQQVNELSPESEADRLQAIRLNSTGVIPQADGYMTVSGDGLSGAIILDLVNPLEEDQRYQLWLVKDGERTSGALLSVDDLGYGGGRVRVPESLFNYARAEVTIETAEGSPQPTSDVILEATLFP